MADLHMETLSDEELVEVIDQGLASLNARFTDPGDPDRDDDKAKAITEACDAWDRFADHFRTEETNT